ncbi:hypothetical protein C809_04017 [Lachnospiraceae bacterium MD335]|jgi:transcriptional regulator with XRE-family HTH domain|nr:hypothetical protein C809_04017 [Lachnospiraceae bacterium MD335]
MEISKRITHFRTLKGYSVNKLANLSGISQSYLREVELGNKNPTVEILSLLCDTLDISLKDFFDDQLSNDFFRDPLIAEIYRLSPEQRNALHHFLKAINL